MAYPVIASTAQCQESSAAFPSAAGGFASLQVLPVASRTAAYFSSQLGVQSLARWLNDLEKDLPSVSFAPEVVSFLQGVTLILVAWSYQLMGYGVGYGALVMG